MNKTLTKAHIILSWEQDWQCDTMYYKVTEDGVMLKYDVETETLYEYPIDQVAH